MTNHKQIIAALAVIQKKVLAGCKTCGGTNEYIRPELFENDPLAMAFMAQAMEKGHADCEKSACPDCAEVRALDFMVHERVPNKYDADDSWITCTCEADPMTQDLAWYNCKHLNLNKDLTTHMHGSKLWIVHVMQVLGVWDTFIEWQEEELFNFRTAVEENEWDSGRSPLETEQVSAEAIADILTDGKHLVPAIGAYLEDREAQ